jgi:hypothetical protein
MNLEWLAYKTPYNRNPGKGKKAKLSKAFIFDSFASIPVFRNLQDIDSFIA